MGELASNYPEQTDAEFKEKQNEFEKLVNEHSRSLFNYSLKLCRIREQAEDTYSQAILNAWKSFDTYNRDKSFLGWMKTIIYNVFVTNYRVNQRTQTFSLDQNPILASTLVDPGQSPEDKLIARIDIENKINALGKLTPEQASTINDHLHETHADTANNLNISNAAARKRLSRVRQVLREDLER
jgi:RNA polymerase sigma factor (sigma-70 family)